MNTTSIPDNKTEVSKAVDIFKKLTDAKNKDHYMRIMPLLEDYKQKSILITEGKDQRECTGISLHSNPIMIEENVAYLQSLLAEMGFQITFNKNTYTIFIR